MREPTHDDFIAARKLIASALDAPPAAGPPQHDHQAELGMYWYHDRPLDTSHVPGLTKTSIDQVCYWLESGNLVREYFVLQAGANYSESLRQGFIRWLRRGPTERRLYVDGDDMRRAALVDWYLQLVR